MGEDRITELRIEGLRTIERIRLPLDGLTVLIGENGSGKSSIVEACELLRRAAGPQLVPELHAVHGGMFSLLRDGASELRLGVTVEHRGDEPPLRYDFALASQGVGTVVTEESLQLGPGGHVSEPLMLIARNGESVRLYDPSRVGSRDTKVGSSTLVLGSAGSLDAHRGIERMKQALDGIEVHVPFEVLPRWAARAHQRRSAMREETQLSPVERLDRLGENLASAYHALKTEYGEEHWQTTLAYVRLGLGDHVDTVNARSGAGGGAISLWLKLRNSDRQIPASVLSDGELSYLAFVALNRLRRSRTLLAVDEPELHMHPGLLSRVVGLLEDLAVDHPVLLATHSDNLLDMLRDPAKSVVVCEIEEPERRTRLRRLDPTIIREWMESYRGVGQVRGEGFLRLGLTEEKAS